MAKTGEGVHPTRMELLETRKKINLAQKGHKLLKQKRDALIMEFFEVVKKAKGLRADLVDNMTGSYKNLVRAEGVLGSPTVDAIAMSMPETSKITTNVSNVMGVRVPKLGVEYKKVDENWASVRSSALDGETKEWQGIIQKMFTLIEVEETVRLLAEEIKNTKRRVNALEYVMLPRLTRSQKYIRMRLEELERENFFRLKTIKKKKG